jgi:hypothetical protein
MAAALGCTILVWMSIKLPGQLSNRPVALDGGQSHLRPECRYVVPAGSRPAMEALLTPLQQLTPRSHFSRARCARHPYAAFSRSQDA